ncbi:MAG: hypothetical protein KBT27_13305 [Prevotellaceae bacterium]|nr:hypothetical protein [Candidatus Faecinaster equi]
MTILYAILTAIAGFIGSQLKKLYEQKINTETKKKAAETVVKAIEQLYSGLEGSEKYIKAFESLNELLAEKGISITELECQMLIESVVAEFNRGWEKDGASNG